MDHLPRSSSSLLSPRNQNGGGGSPSFLTKYFLLILLLFGSLSFILSSRFIDTIVLASGNGSSSSISSTGSSGSSSSSSSAIQNHLENSFKIKRKKKRVERNPSQDIKQEPQDRHQEGDNNNENENKNEHINRLAGLNCDRFGGPSELVAEEMVYWEDIPTDSNFVSPFFKKDGPTQYMTFEPDHGGWNNIRMSMETLLVCDYVYFFVLYIQSCHLLKSPSFFFFFFLLKKATAFAMGRTLVLPPHYTMYLLGKGDNNQRKHFSFEHFFHTERISEEHVGFNIISMQEFLQLFMDGRFKDSKTGQPIFPPNNRTDWNGANSGEQMVLKNWLRKSAHTLEDWNPENCIAAFPRSSDDKDMEELATIYESIKGEGFPKYEEFVGKPNDVTADAKSRLRENWAEREKLCMYDKSLQSSPWVHMGVSRMLVHFYAFLYFADWKMDLWTKRFVRDHVRYIDEIQCAAARVVNAIRKRRRSHSGGAGGGRKEDFEFDTMHIRRGDFQYKVTRFEAKDIYEMTSKQIPDNTTVYIATDERDKSFFNLLKQHYDVVFLDDFKHELEGVNTNYYGMIDQLVASRGRTFYGCWFSTFTGYINRLRGYHADDHQTKGYEDGIIPSYYYALKDRYLHMQEFYPVKKQFYAREFPTSWRLIDTGVTG